MFNNTRLGHWRLLHRCYIDVLGLSFSTHSRILFSSEYLHLSRPGTIDARARRLRNTALVCQGLIMEGFTRHAAIGRTPLDQWSAGRGDLYLTTHNTRKGQTSMSTGWIRTHCPSKLAAAHPRLRPRGYRNQPVNCHCKQVKDGEIYVECSLYTEFWLGSLRIKKLLNRASYI
jgi:hypothetical protein